MGDLLHKDPDDQQIKMCFGCLNQLPIVWEQLHFVQTTKRIFSLKSSQKNTPLHILKVLHDTSNRSALNYMK